MSQSNSSDRPSAILTDFFARGVAVGLHLPDGWFGGRTMENQHELTLAQDRAARLLIELDERVLLVFTGEQLSVERITTDLLDVAGTPAVRVTEFAQLVVDQRLYGSADVSASFYREGAVHFVSAR